MFFTRTLHYDILDTFRIRLSKSYAHLMSNNKHNSIATPETATSPLSVLLSHLKIDNQKPIRVFTDIRI